MSSVKSNRRVTLPPGIGKDLGKELLYNPYQDALLQKRRIRFCLHCRKISSMLPGSGVFECAHCKTKHYSNLTAPRVFNRFGAFAGRRGGKTVVGAHMVREEALIPNGLIWCMGPNFKVLHDSTVPTLLGIIPPSWVAAPGWNSDLMEFSLVNGTKIAFRSLDDPERGRGPGPTAGWLDEAAQIPEQGWNVFEPSLAEQAGIAIFTTTVYGFDWTYDRVEKQALIEKAPGFFAVKWWTEENPIFQHNEVLRNEIETKRRTTTPEWFAQEYRAERHNATGAIYAKYLTRAHLQNAEAVKRYIPEWPNINPDREIWIGLDAGADHPFGATMGVVTEWGIVIVAEYLQRDAAYLVHLQNIQAQFNLRRFTNIKWVANKNERQLRAEFGLRGVGVIQAENKHEFGIQRVQSWFVSNQLFIAYTCPHTFDQFTKYRYAQNTANDGQQKKEGVYKLEDELPDCVRYKLMAYPRLPDPKVAAMTDAQKTRWESLDERSRLEIERMREFHKTEGQNARDLSPLDKGYPLGNFFGVADYSY
jgi:phage terminase large subunit